MPDHYSMSAKKCAAMYEEVRPETTYASWLHLIPPSGSYVLDVGAGSGRDAAWLATMGHDVTAVEPSDTMREKAQSLHSRYEIHWIKDSLPKLDKVFQLGHQFSMILLNAVWIHVPPQERVLALENLKALLGPRGILVITLRHGPSPDDRIMYDCSEGELSSLAARVGLHRILSASLPDALGRDEVTWTHLVFSTHLEERGLP